MKSLRFFPLIFLLLLVPANIYTQETNPSTLRSEVVAKVGSITIDGEEFLERYEFTPLFRKQIRRMTESLKLEFLYSLVAEKLWALQAESMHFDTLEVMRYVSEKFEKMFVRDALYRREVTDKMKIPDQELIRGYVRYNKKLEVNYLFSKKKKEIFNLYNLLSGGIPFDSLLSARPESAEQSKPEEIVFGQMAEAVEDSLYELRIGGYTAPLLTPDGWYIFRLTGEKPNNLNTGQEDAAKSVEKIVRKRKEDDLYAAYYKDFFESKKVQTNAVLFRSLASKLSIFLTRKKDEYKIKDEDPVSFSVYDIKNIEDEFGPDSLNMIYIEYKSNPETLAKFIRDIVFDGWHIVKTDYESVMKLLSAMTRENIEHELLAREGIKEGLNSLPSVMHDVKVWRENYLAQLLKGRMLDTVSISEDELHHFYETYNKEEKYPVEVNITEVLNSDPAVVEKVIKEVKKGGNIRRLAYQYTQRAWTKKDSGNFGWFPVTMYGQLGKIAGSLEPGDLYGPIKLPEGYSVFKLNGKRPARDVPPQPFEKVKNDLRRELVNKKEEKTIAEYTLKLAEKFGVDINVDVLHSIKVTSLNTFGFRYLGFGGRITAAPMMMPNTGWVDDYIRQRKINP